MLIDTYMFNSQSYAFLKRHTETPASPPEFSAANTEQIVGFMIPYTITSVFAPDFAKVLITAAYVSALCLCFAFALVCIPNHFTAGVCEGTLMLQNGMKTWKTLHWDKGIQKSGVIQL